MSLADPYNMWRVQTLEFRTTVTDHSRGHEETKSMLNVGNLCYQSVQNRLCFRLLVSENMKIKICKSNVLPAVNGTKTRFLDSQNCEKRLLASSCPTVRLSISMEQLGSHWADFHEI